MPFSLPFFIGFRYTKSRKKNHFVSFISLSSMLGIALGVMVLITVLSVMNGFDEEIHKRFFGMAPELTVTSVSEGIPDWEPILQDLEKNPSIRAISPFVGAQALLSFEGQISPIVMMGVIPEKEEYISHIKHKMILGQMNEFEPFGMVIGRTLADNLGLMLGDQVTLMLPKASVTPVGILPKFKRFIIQGIFSAGSGFGFENKLAFVNLKDAQKLSEHLNEVTGFKIKINHPYDAPVLSEQLAETLGESFHVGNWTTDFGAFFQAVKMEKTMMFFVLLLIVAVAAFNLVSSLVMVVNDKQSEIAILRTLGATPRFILSVFMVQGMLIGLIGTFIGLCLGLTLAYYAPTIVEWLQSYWQISVLSSNIYWVDFLPSKILMTDVLLVCFVALFLSFLATLYPAWRASRVVIAEALHYE